MPLSTLMRKGRSHVDARKDAEIDRLMQQMDNTYNSLNSKLEAVMQLVGAKK